MTLRLTVESGAWRAHVDNVVSAFDDVLPVVKGNGYGLGRSELLTHAKSIAQDVAIGNVHELTDVPHDMRPFVLTPVGVGVTSVPRSDAVLSVGSSRDLELLAALGATNPVVIKVESSMHRYGIDVKDARKLRNQAEAAGHNVIAWSIHLPLAGTDDDHADEAIAIARELATDLPIHLSHIGVAVQRIRAVVSHRVVVRTGTQLWLGDKSMFGLHADVISVRPASFATAGYRATPISPSGTSPSRIVMVGCGSTNGVGALEDGRSPFHFAKQRLPMLEAPHMHTTMLSVAGDTCPQAGDWVDVQQPLTRVHPDVVVWR